MVATINGGEPHYVVMKSNRQYICNVSCPRFVTYKIWQHVVAAAEHSGSLCQWWKSLHDSPNLDSLAMSGLPKGVAGQKGGVTKRGRRGKWSKGTLQLTVSYRISIESCATGFHITEYSTLQSSSPVAKCFSSSYIPHVLPMQCSSGYCSMYHQQLCTHPMVFNHIIWKC